MTEPAYFKQADQELEELNRKRDDFSNADKEDALRLILSLIALVDSFGHGISQMTLSGTWFAHNQRVTRHAV